MVIITAEFRPTPRHFNGLPPHERTAMLISTITTTSYKLLVTHCANARRRGEFRHYVIIFALNARRMP